MYPSIVHMCTHVYIMYISVKGEIIVHTVLKSAIFHTKIIKKLCISHSKTVINISLYNIYGCLVSSMYISSLTNSFLLDLQII